MKTLATLLIWLAFVGGAAAQGCGQNNPNCIVPTAPPGTSDNRAASTAFVQQAVGGGSGTFGTIGAVISAAPMSSFVNVLSQNNGVSQCPLTFARGTMTPTGQYQEFQDSSGVWWEPQFASTPVQACQFGTVPDGTFNFATPPVYGGTDNTLLIQNALDYSMRNKFKGVCLADGFYRITDTIAVGWGIQNNTATAFSTSLLACNGARAAYDSFAGVTILPQQTDRCAFNVSGGRDTRISGIHVVGSNYSWGQNRLAPGNLPMANTAAGWLDPAITPSGGQPGGLTQFAPFAAFCVDAYNGAKPGLSYPNQTFPAWLNTTTQYNQAGSTDTEIDNTVCEGFVICWAFGTGPGQQNGDFNKVWNSTCLYSVYCFSFGSSQARNQSIINVQCSNIYSYITNQQFGQRAGELGGHILNPSCGQIYQYLDVTLSVAGTTFQDFYCEACVRLGNVSGGSITFRQGTFSQNEPLTGRIPVAMVEVAAGGGSIRFEDVNLGGSGRIGVIVHSVASGGSVSYINGKINGCIFAGALINTVGEMNACNYTGGYFLGASNYPQLGNGFGIQGSWQGTPFGSLMTSPSAGAILTQVGWAQYPINASASTRLLWTQAMQGFYDATTDQKYWRFLRGPILQGYDMSASWATAPVITNGCDLWLGQWSPGQELSSNGNLSLGDMFYHIASGTLWVVEGVQVPNPTNYGIILRQQNNLNTTGNPSACATNNLSTVPTGNAILTHIAQPSAVTAAAIVAGGTGYGVSPQTLTIANGAAGSNGVCTILPTISVNTTGGVVTAVNSISAPGQCPMPLTNPVSVTGGGGTGATFNLTYTPGIIAIPGTVMYCDFVQGSAVMVNCGRGDGNGSVMSTVLLPGDRFWASTQNDSAQQWPFPANGYITSVTAGSPGSIGLNTLATKTGRFPILPLGNDLPTVSAFQSSLRYSAAGIPVPACNGNTNGVQLPVSDATAPTYRGAYTSGGTVQAGVICINGTGWLTVD